MDIDISSHLTSDELALLAEGNAGEAAHGFRRHLAHCRSCYQAYEDAVETRGHWLAEREASASPELIQAGRAVGVGRESDGGVTQVSWLRLAATMAGVFGLFVAGWLYVSPRKQVEPPWVEVVQSFVASESENGLVPPGIAGTEVDVRDFRGETQSSPEVESIVDSLRTAHKREETTPDDLFWLINALLASGNHWMARHYLPELEPLDELRFLKLRAILAYRENRLLDAKNDLRAVLEQSPNDAETEFNLGVVLLELGENTEALQLLERARGSKVPEIVRRAEMALDSSGSH